MRHTLCESRMIDLKRLGKLKNLDANAPDAMKTIWAFDKAVLPRVR